MSEDSEDHQYELERLVNLALPKICKSMVDDGMRQNDSSLTPSELSELSKEYLRRVPGLGKTRIDAVERWLLSHGLQFKGDHEFRCIRRLRELGYLVLSPEEQKQPSDQPFSTKESTYQYIKARLLEEFELKPRAQVDLDGRV